MKIEFYSHLDSDKPKKLSDHLFEVGEAAKKFITRVNAENKDLYAQIAYIVGISHDFGKYTTFFQDRLFKRRDWGRKSDHSFISAAYASWLVEYGLQTLGENFSRYAPLIAYFAVLHHHGDLSSLNCVPSKKDLKNSPDFSSAEPNLREKLLVVNEQLEDIKSHKSQVEKDFKRLFGKEINLEAFFQNWQHELSRLSELKYEFLNKEQDKIKLKVLITVLLIYSALIDADKRDAAQVTAVKRKVLLEDMVDKYRQKSFNLISTRPIDRLRNEIYNKAVDEIIRISLENQIFTITAPTGSGKTLTAFSCALKLRKRIEKEQGYSPRIIYSLPFISIIEQNYDVIRKVLENSSCDFEANESSYLLRHHHLADLEYRVEDESKSLDEALLLTESWESEIIITTFVQFLHSIIGFKNSFLKKYHNIAKSIILLDEVQNIPVEYWNLVRKVIKLLVTDLGCYVILLTATKPLIFRKEDGPLELVKNANSYFEQMNRVKLISDFSNKTVEELVEWFKNTYVNNHSYLIVLNTIRCSKEIYEAIRKDFGERTFAFKRLKGDYSIFKEELNGRIPLIYLSTSIIPAQREERLGVIKNLLADGIKPILVSTQVVEAGVDIDFDVALRDIGPLDSIVQVSGRCNREGARCTPGEVFVFSLDNYSSYVYGKIHPYITKQLISDKGQVTEDQFFDLINKYFEEVKPRVNDDKSKDIWRSMLKLNFSESGVNNFNLIDERGEYLDIFIEIDESAKEVWQKYINEVASEKDFRKRKIVYLKIRQDFRSYIVSVRKQNLENIPRLEGNFGYVSSDELKDYYSMETGYKVRGEAFIW